MAFTPITPGSLNWDVPVNTQFTNDDTRLNGIDGTLAFVNSVLTLFSAQLAAVQNNDFGPTDQGLKSWTFDPVGANVSFGIAAGQLYINRFILLTDQTMNNIVYNVGTAGSGLTAAQNWVAVYDSTGVRKAVSTDQTTNFGSTGTKTASTGSISLTAGAYFIAFLANGTTPPSIRGNTNLATLLNAGTTTANPRFAQSGAGQTVTPTTFTVTSAVAGNAALWGAIT